MTVDWMKAIRSGMPQSDLRRALERGIANWDGGIDSVCREAPHVVVAHAPGSRQQDCITALTYVELAAHFAGLGSCRAGWLDGAANTWRPLQLLLGLPEGSRSCGVLMLGYPKYRHYRIPLRRKARIVWQ